MEAWGGELGWRVGVEGGVVSSRVGVGLAPAIRLLESWGRGGVARRGFVVGARGGGGLAGGGKCGSSGFRAATPPGAAGMSGASLFGGLEVWMCGHVWMSGGLDVWCLDVWAPPPTQPPALQRGEELRVDEGGLEEAKARRHVPRHPEVGVLRRRGGGREVGCCCWWPGGEGPRGLRMGAECRGSWGWSCFARHAI